MDAAVVVFLGALIIGRMAWRKNNSGARLGALMALFLGVWAMVAVYSTTEAGRAASLIAAGIATVIVALARLIGAL